MVCRSADWPSTLKMRTVFSLPYWAIPTAPIQNAGYTAPPTGARPGKECCTRMRTPGLYRWPSIPITPRSSMPTSGLTAWHPGRTGNGKALKADCSRARTAEIPGRNWLKDYPLRIRDSGVLASVLPPPIQIVYTPP